MGAVDLKWVWSEIFRARFAHNHIFSPPNLQYLPTPMAAGNASRVARKKLLYLVHVCTVQVEVSDMFGALSQGSSRLQIVSAVLSLYIYTCLHIHPCILHIQ